VVVVVGPDADIAGEIFWIRRLSANATPAARLIRADVSGSLAPFSYIIFAHTGGIPLAAIEDPTLIKVAARAVGRTMRRIHQIPAPAFGRPSPADRWPLHGWQEVLRVWLEQSSALQYAADWLGPPLLADVLAQTLEHADIVCVEPRMIHGAIGPQRVLVSTGESIQLEVISRPGALIAGDPLLDVAQALLPTQTPAFRQGFLEGYAAAGPLDPAQRQKLRRLGIVALLEAAARSQDPELLARLPVLVSAEMAHLAQSA
jgi:aminoglycoside phosphotransferase (APT) family kinase protein